jgi:DNA replication and repair protein RecF
VLHGHNGAGKTNVLEALYLVATLRSFRSADFGPLVRHGRPRPASRSPASTPSSASARACRPAAAAASDRPGASPLADGKLVRSGLDFYGRLRAILFTPEDLGVLRGSARRSPQFLDRVLFARERTHIKDIQDYEKLLRSRNRVLREEQAAARPRRPARHLRGRPRRRRRKHLDPPPAAPRRLLHDRFSAAFRGIHGPTPCPRPLHYVSKLGALGTTARPQVLAEALRDRRRHDLARGTTTVGPHRDDFDMQLAGRRPALRLAGSGPRAHPRLQDRRAAGRPRAHRRGPAAPARRRVERAGPGRSAQLFAALVREAGQCVLTTTAPHFIALDPGEDCRYIEVRGGLVQTAPDKPT